MYNPYDHYFQKAKKTGYKARSIFKLEEIDEKYKIFSKDTKNILDIGSAPGSWIQYVHKKLNDYKICKFNIIGFDIKEINLNLTNVDTYVQDITNYEEVEKIISNYSFDKFDVIISDMAPNTIGIKDIDAIRSIGLLEKTLPIYEKYLKSNGKFVIKIFMGPGFDEFVNNIKKIYGGKKIKMFKPQATRKASKEIYIIRY